MEPFDVEQKIANINVSKSSGPDGIHNWFLRDFPVWLSELEFLTPLLKMAYFHSSGNKLMLLLCRKYNNRVTLRLIYARFP